METILKDLYCRLCADLKPVKDLTNMLLDTEKCQGIASKLTRLDLHVNFNTILPKTVCSECINSLERAYDFVKSVEVAQEAFEDYDSSVFDIENKDEISDSDNMDKSIKDDMSITTEDTNPDESEIGQEYLIEYTPKNEVKAENPKSKPEKKITTSKATTFNKTTRRIKPKISANVDLDTWLDYNWLCAFCDKFFPSPIELKVHSMQYHKTCNPYRCFDCRARGLHMNNFVTHISKHRPVLKLMCYKCSHKCETLKELNAHKATHFDAVYICNGCNTTFPNKEELDDHMTKFYKNAEANAVLDIENDSLTCVICEKTLYSRLTLERHLKLHTERKRNFFCGTCDASFYNKKELIQHQIVHSNARPYKCEICQYSFKIRQDLKTHVLVHFGPKRFTCKDCGKCFKANRELVSHSVIHKEIRPFKCKFCSSSFRFKHLLKQHSYLHTGTKPYACTECPKTFTSWSNHNKHMREIHDIETSKRKRTSEGLYAVDPETNEIIYPDKKKVLEWKKQILGDMKKGRPRKTAVNSEAEVKSVMTQDSQESDRSYI